MFESLRIYTLIAFLAAIHHISGNYTIPNLETPKVFGFGWPPFLVNVSMETIPVDGLVQYDLLFNSTCPFMDDDRCSSNVTDLSPVNRCHAVLNQTSRLIKSLSCVICNSTEHCKSMGISEDGNLCFYFKVTTPMGSSSKCMERNFLDIIVLPPPKSIQVLATERRKLTVQWERPDEIQVDNVIMKYQMILRVILQDHLGKCSTSVPRRYGQEGDINTYTITSLTAWTNYSVTICCAISSGRLANKCTCGGRSSPRYIPGGPVFQRTLPEEPSKPPLLLPCEASCDDKYFSAILKWKDSDGQIWNGIPTKTIITVWNLPGDHEESKLGALVANLTVPLSVDYNGSLLTHTIHNLSSHLTYSAQVQFCSNGGCGPTVERSLSCENCESRSVAGTPSAKHEQSNRPESHLTMEIAVACVSSVFVIVAVACFAWYKRKKRDRNLPTIGEVIGDVTPENYEQADFSDLPLGNGPYNWVDFLDRQLLLPDDQTTEYIQA